MMQTAVLSFITT